jgi:hypothetical protein
MLKFYRTLSLVGLLALSSSTCGLLATAEDAPKKPEVEVKKDAPAEAVVDPAAQKWQPLFDGKTLDGWKVTEFGTGGDIVVEDGHILIGYGDGCTGLTWAKDFPKVDYEVLIEAQRYDGTDFFCGLTFPVQESPCSLIVGGWGGALVGLSSIDGEDAAHNNTKQVRLRVTKSHIAAWIDDKRVILQETAGHKFTIRPEVHKSLPFGICTWCTTAAVRKAQFRPLTAEEALPEKAPVVEAVKTEEKPAEKAQDK